MSARGLFLAGLVALVGACGTPTARPATTTTLRALYGAAAPTEIAAGKTALVLVDFQEEFFRGPLPVERAAEAVASAAKLRTWARARGILVVHVRNVSGRPTSPIFNASSRNVDIVEPLAPVAGETVLTKSMAGAFSRTDLDARLRARGIDTLVVAGIMTHLAVDTTARDGMVLGYRVLVAADACATRPLPSPLGGRPIAASVVHETALASLSDRFADVLSTDTIASLAVVP